MFECPIFLIDAEFSGKSIKCKKFVNHLLLKTYIAFFHLTLLKKLSVGFFFNSFAVI